MSEWKKVKLVDICDIRSGKRLPKGTDFSIVPTNYKYIRARDIKNGIINGENLAYITKDVKDKISKYIVNANDIAITIVGASVGDVAYVSPEFDGINLTENAVRLTNFKDNTNPRFIFYILNSPEYYLLMQQIAGGAAQPKMGIYKVEAIEVCIPSIFDQNRIVDILSRYDSLVENYQKQIKLLEEAAQRLYKEWFVDLHFPGHENTKTVDGVPEGWEKKKISEVCDTIGGGTPSTKVLSYYENGTISWVTPTDITKNNSLCLLSTEKKITKEGLDHSSAKMLPAETILMTSRASVGFFGICDFEVCTNQGFISCVPFDNNFQMFLLYNLMNRVEEIRIKAGGSTYLEISKSVFRNFDIICPKDNLICLFQKEAHQLLERMRMICKQIRLLTEARDRLLPKLMSGEIEV